MLRILGFMNGFAHRSSSAIFTVYRAPLSTNTPFHTDLLADQSEHLRSIFLVALPQQQRKPGLPGDHIPEKPVSFYEEDIQSKMTPASRASLSSFHHFCDALSSPEDAKKIPQLLKKYVVRGVPTTERTASCVVRAACRAGTPEVALQVIADRDTYRLFPTLRAMNYLMYRFLHDGSIEANTDALKGVLKTYKAILKHGRNPNNLSRELLSRSVLLTAQKDEERLAVLVKMYEPSAGYMKTLPQLGTTELVKELKGKSRQDLLKKLKESVDQRRKAGEAINPHIKSALESV